MGFLDYTGLARFKQKLDVLFAGKLDTSLKGAANGLAELDSTGKVVSSQLPDIGSVIEVASYSNLPATGAEHTIYITTDTNESYRWDTNHYDKIANPNDMVGASGSSAGTSGLVPAPSATDNTKFLRGDGTWQEGGKPMVILSYGNSTWNDFITAYNNNVIVYCRASSNSNPATGSQTRMAFMAYVNNAASPTEVEFQYYRSVSSHSASQQGDQVFVYKLTSSGSWTVTQREAMAKIVAGTNLSSTYSNNVLTINGNYQSMTGASASTVGTTGLVPAPSAGDQEKFLKGDGTWANAEETVYANTIDMSSSDSTKISEAIAEKVDKVTGKGLSTNDYTTADQTAVQTTLPNKITAIETAKGANGGYAELDSSGKVPTSQLPSYVDDVEEYPTLNDFPATGESGKIYVATSTNITYRWGGSEYVPIGSDLALGETSSTAYRGDRGKAAYDHATAKGSAYANGFYKITTNSEGHVTSASAVQKSDITDLGIPGSHQDISGKADKVSNATSGNFAGLDSNGNLTDSGSKASDFLTQHQDISGKADKVSNATSGNFAGLDVNGNLTDSGHSSEDYLEEVYDAEYTDQKFNEKDWFFINSYFRGYYVWSDGEHYYYSQGSSTQWVFDESTSSWVQKKWNGLTNIYGGAVWSDGDDIYFSNSSVVAGNYVLNKSTSTWEDKTWYGITNLTGAKIWSDGENTYYSNSSTQYVLNKATSTWSAKTWTGLTSFDGAKVWLDGENVYYSNGSNQYVLDKTTSTWSAKTWNGFTEIDGSQIWTDGENTYYSYNNNQYVLNASTSTWNEKTWNGLTSFNGEFVWTKENNIYYGAIGYQYILNKETSTWSEVTWLCPFTLTGKYIWTDKGNIYYSNGDNLVYDKSTSVWNIITLNGLNNVDGSYIWSDGDNIYYSNYSYQYVLDKATSTWSQKTWSGLTRFYGSDIWTDGDNIYHSSDSKQYVLNKSTSTWESKTWTGLTALEGSHIWTDGDNIYYSANSSLQYVLDKTTSSWIQKTWNGFTNLDGKFVWSGNDNIYYSYYTDQYVLDKSTSTWNQQTWNELTSFNGNNIWSDGKHAYYSYNKDQYVLTSNQDQILVGKEGQWERVPVDEFIMGGSTSSSAGASGLVPAPAAGDNVKYLMGNGTWEVAPGARIVQVITTVTNTSGAYTDTIQDARISADMKAIGLEIANPYVFNDKITVTCNAGSVTFSCNNVTGTSVVKINIIKADTNTTIMTSEEFDTLNATKVDKDQGIANAGKALGINAQGMVEPVPFSGEDFTGATRSTAGTHGYVPAPAAGDNAKFLKGDGTWGTVPYPPNMAGATATTPGLSGLVPAPAAGAQDKVLTGAGTWVTPVGSRLLVVDLDDVTNTSGSYTHTTTVTGMTSDLKAVAIECSDPTVFKGKVTVTTGTNSVTLTCSDVAGSSTVKVSFLAIGNANPLSSTEYGALDTRIGQLSDLDTTDKSSVVDAINEVNGNLADNLGGTENMFKFATDGNGKYGYVKKVSGADTFVPFKDSIVGCTFLGYGLPDPSAASSTFTNLSGKEDCYLFLAARSTSSGYVNSRANVTSSSGCTLTLIEKTTQMQIGSNYLATALYKMSNLTSSVNITTGKDAYATAEKYIIQMPLG